MIREPSFVTSLREALHHVPKHIKESINSHWAMTDDRLIQLVSRPYEPSVSSFQSATESDYTSYDPTLVDVGNKAITDGQIAYCIMAGGLGSRAHGPKALLRFSNGLSLLAMKLMQAPTLCPTVVMVSPSIANRVAEHVSEMSLSVVSVGAFIQHEFHRLTADYQPMIIDGRYELAPTGHGDLPFAMLESGILNDFDAHGIKHVVITNVDNAFGVVDPVIVGQHIASEKHVTFQVTERRPNDRGGGLVGWVDGRLQAVETFRLPDSVDPSQEKWNNTNSIIVSVEALRDSIEASWRWYQVRKIVDSRLVIQYERLIQQLTEIYDTCFINVPRDTHYLPIKTLGDLAHARKVLFKD